MAESAGGTERRDCFMANNFGQPARLARSTRLSLMSEHRMRDVQLFQRANLLAAELELLSRERVGQMPLPGRADDRRGHAWAMQQPGERDLGGRNAAPGRHLRYPVDDVEVRRRGVERVAEGIGS